MNSKVEEINKNVFTSIALEADEALSIIGPLLLLHTLMMSLRYIIVMCDRT